MVQRLMTPSQGARHLYKHNHRNKHEVQLERIPFDETSKFLDAAFDGEKEHNINQQFIKHARDHYKCSCTVCFSNDSNLLELSPERARAQIEQCQAAAKMNRSISLRGQSEGIHRRTTYQETQSGADFSSSNFGNTPYGYSTIQQNMNSITYNGPDHDTELCFILRRLIPPSRVNRTLRLYIPETVIFWHGEAKLLAFTSSKDSQLKFIRQREKLQLNELRKFLNERRTKYRLSVEAKLEEQRLVGLDYGRSNSTNYNINSAKRNLEVRLSEGPQQQLLSTPRGPQLEFFQANRRVSDLSKFSQPSLNANYNSNNNNNNNNNNTPIDKQQQQQNPMKQIGDQTSTKRNIPSHQYSSGFSSVNEPSSTTNKQIVNLSLLPSSIPLSPATTLIPPQISPSHSMLQSPVGNPSTNGSTFPEREQKEIKEAKEAILYKADSMSEFESEHTIVINEPDFLILMMKRKIDPIWTNMHYLQNFVRVKKNKFELQLFHFVYEEQKDSELFLRAFRDIQMLNSEISSVSLEYIAPEVEEDFEMHLMSEQSDSYQLYMACKIFHFLQTFHNVTLLSMDSEWLIDDVGTLFLINCKNISYNGQGRTYITTEMYFKRIEEQAEKKLALRVGLEDKYKDSQKIVIDKFAQVIKENYEGKKRKLGIVQTKKVRQEIDISDEVFGQICPQIKFRLSDLLRTNAPIRVLQKEILGEKAKSLREKNEERNSQMFSKVYCSPTKSSAQKKRHETSNALSQSSMRETFSILSKIDPPHRRVFSAHHSSSKQRMTATSFCEEDITPSDFKRVSTPNRPLTAKSNLKSTSNSSNLLFHSPSAQVGATLDTDISSSSKKASKSKKKTLPYYLFSNSKY